MLETGRLKQYTGSCLINADRGEIIKKFRVCITGDVHQSTANTLEQKLSDKKEPETVEEYLKIARRYGVKITLFITGKTFIDDWNIIKKTLRYEY